MKSITFTQTDILHYMAIMHRIQGSGVKAWEGQAVDDDNATKKSFLIDLPTSHKRVSFVDLLSMI